MSERQKKTETFIIKIMNQQNSTWQGSVTWVDEQREQYFRRGAEKRRRQCRLLVVS